MEQQKHKRVYAIDGVRFLAILGVIFYHLSPYLVPGGFLGVDLFLIISAYLLTTSLKRSLDSKGQIHLMTLVKKRLLRLLGPMLWMVLLVVSYLFWLQPVLLHDSRASILSGITFTNNWWQILNGISYFEAAMTPNVFGHLWYIAIIFQFTVIWAIVYTFLVKVIQKDTVIKVITAGLVLVSAILMAVLFKAGTDPTRVYYGTDTRAFSFLLGALLAMFFPYESVIQKHNYTKAQRQKLLLFGTVLLATMAYLMFNLNDAATITYRGGIFVYAVLSSLLFVIILLPTTFWHRAFSFKPMVWLGQRSYSYYMWYYPVSILFQQQATAKSLSGVTGIVFQLILIAMLGEVSYVLIERQMLTKIFGRSFWRAIYINLKHSRNKTIKILKGVLIATVMLFIPVSFIFGLINASSGENKTVTDIAKSIEDSYSSLNKNNAKETDKETDKEKDKKSGTDSAKDSDKENNKDKGTDQENKQPNDSDKNNDQEKDSEKEDKQPADEGPTIEGLTPEESQFAANLAISFFGDSTLQATAANLQEVFPKALFDGQQGRQLSQSQDSLRAFVDSGKALDTVVLMLGTNGGFSTEQINGLIETLGNREVVLVTTHAPRSWQNEVNERLTEAANSHANVVLVDWNAAVSGHDDWLYDDHIHPNPNGSHEFALYLARQLTALLDK